jgi:trans-aconitate 2-methyltransferase
VEGTALRPLLDALAEDERDRFIAEYRAQLAVAYPPDGSGVTLYPFPRLFIVCVR